ncbi:MULTISPECIES: DNA phosphorothioation-dependent restriction protein DptF [Sphingobacterium]|uniref:DNA phosphorothioation-dependent restriction protein DptF n=1 Tax=Sphingobacterium phlebotomi TaxID=2605433 RepID=A0A5D4HBH0_9SPHI|nr:MULTISPECIES: DNA phosphorothioation-dependent restriction protein DptF [Sphingobacterium]NGM67317.1 DNA phosphorothioation-dependent restriction protein DptF [Sphingobacterium sp. SGR-19]TYR36160.1 DNA phosphorothioation-dependent restriction protein DptF [Sphingobacterium phlebotomi]
MNTHPLITELQKLKESSRFAIAQGGKYDLDDFKKYLHIEREVESQLKHIIVESSKRENAQLVLVCGNVGDGKSHILSYLHGVIPDEMGKFVIHNDATESHNPNETSNDTLYKVLNGFKDENIKSSTDKIILAINLGTLSKFLEVHGAEFQKLWAFVEDQSILDNAKVSANVTKESINFRQINFTDFHLYSLTDDGPISTTISELLDKIVAPESSNIIYEAYTKIKDQPEFVKCPVKYNYEFLLNTENRKLITQLLIQAIAQNKEIVSVRSLLNFIHDLIVPIQLSSTSETEQKTTVQQLSEKEFVSALIPNYIFEHADLSNIFSRLSELDPCNIRDSETDEKLLKLQSADNPIDLFAQDINTELYGNVVHQINIQQINKDVISKYFVRLLFFQNGRSPEKDIFLKYMTWLYHFNRGDVSYLGKLYELVENATKKWYGDPKNGDKVILRTGRRQTKYRVFKDFSLQPQPVIPNEGGNAVLHQFVQEFVVRYVSPTTIDKTIQIAIDFSLFRTLLMIRNGYRPNKKDNNNFIYFVYFINEVTQEITQNTLYIDEVNVGKPVDYKLTKNAFGGYKFERVS